MPSFDIDRIDEKLRSLFGVNPKGDGSDDALAINKAISDAASVKGTVWIRGNVSVATAIVMASGVRVVATGRIVAGSQATIASFDGVEGATWEGGELVGDGATDGQSGFVLNDAVGCTLRDVTVSGVLNKGIAIAGTSTDNHVWAAKVIGSAGTFGAGFSIYGANVSRNTLHGGYFTGSRIGVTLNGGTYNSVIDVNACGNNIAGLMLDGIESGTGDGAKYCSVIGGTFNDNLDTASPSHYGGIYLGNGSSYNRIVGVVAKGNASAGIRTSATVGLNENVGNLFEGVTADSNGNGGIVLSGAPDTRIVAPFARANTVHGIVLFQSDNSTIEGGEARDNGASGVFIQSESARVRGAKLRGNDKGISIQFGGTTVSGWHELSGLDVGENATADYDIASGMRTRIETSSGAITDTVYEQGDASYTHIVKTSTVRIIRISEAITADRTTQLDALGARPGDTVRVVRSSAATGAFLHSVVDEVGTLRRLTAPGQWVEATFDGTRWQVSGWGSDAARPFSLPYSASIDFDASRSSVFAIAPSNGSAYTLNAPSSPSVGQIITVRVSNTTGGALGTMTWAAGFKMAAWTQPATGNSQAITFYYSGSSWFEIGRTAADVPN